jgi:3-oxoacyl-[acyl-carrier-protein] synthase-3
MFSAVIRAIEFHLPEKLLGNEELAAMFPSWSPKKIEEKTGICFRHIAAEGELASDLAFRACEKLFNRGICTPEDIDFILLCTQSPDYLLPTTACLLQNRLGIPTTSGAIDFNLGCSGFVYGLSLAKGIIETNQASNVLLITAETYSKHLSPQDVSVRAIFGDAATATLIVRQPNAAEEVDQYSLGPFVFGTDGGGGDKLILRQDSIRERCHPTDGSPHLKMNGPDIYAFTLQTVPTSVEKLLKEADIKQDDIDMFILHQANKYMLENLRLKMKIPSEKFYYALKNYGNTVSSTIPIALKCASDEGAIAGGDLLALIGFGVGLSWAGTLMRHGPWLL